eukprot:1185495-Prorocentrum_minimum.AAC.2
MVEAAQGRAHLECLPRGIQALHIARVAIADPKHPSEHASLSRPHQVADDDCAIPTSLALQVSWERRRQRSRPPANCSSAQSRQCSARPEEGTGCQRRFIACCATGISAVSVPGDRTARCVP